MPGRMATVVAKVCTILFWNMENISILLVVVAFRICWRAGQACPQPFGGNQRTGTVARS